MIYYSKVTPKGNKRLENMNLHLHAIAAARAARNPQWGRQACLRYCQRLGVPHSIYTLARVLAEAERAGL